MKNKMELTYIVKDDGMAEISMKANATGLEMMGITLRIIDNLAKGCTRTPEERTFFLKTISKMILKLI